MLIGVFSNAQHFIFKTYAVEDGLVSNPVRRIFQDSKGFIWSATPIVAVPVQIILLISK
jgi:hypothetical protein